MQRVPVELIERIFNESLWEDVSTAKSASLVCRHLKNLGQRLAFRRLKLLIATGGDTGPLIAKLEGLATHPILLSHVTDLDLEVLGRDKDCIAWMKQHVALLTSVLDLVQLGHPLQRLCVSGQWGFREWMTCREGAPESGVFKKRLYQMAAIPTIQSLDLIALPSIILHRRMPALKHLTTRCLFRSSRHDFRKAIDSPKDGATSSISTVLKTLSIGGLLSSYSRGYTWDDFDYLADASNTNILLHALKEVSLLCHHHSNWEGARGILDKCRASLETLTFRCYGIPVRSLHLRLEILAFPKLRKLTVMLPLKKYGHPGSPISWLSSELATDSTISKDNLEEIVLFIVLALDQEPDEQEYQDLANISETLSSQEKFSRLRRVKIVICFHQEFSPLAEGFVRQESRARPYTSSLKALGAVNAATEAVSQRKLEHFEMKCEFHDTSPWGWY
ncbi:hypothetical protein BKA70DRAFT_1402216 [Coprinopsis sp. MPI-PUGE-AT-0042]|nr:hypothetical protein BKA70DRAFT_1402216 [Coprinopsis sp. MPI-PUGE-AT-0042]